MNAAFELIYPLQIHSSLFIGKEPSAVLFGDERVNVKTWQQVVGIILARCDSEQHERLMYLRDKVYGKIQRILSASDSGMRRPLKICEDMYIETYYSSQTMMYILRCLVLAHTEFDYSNISIAIKRK
ncbi:MAG: hypothetical protein LBK75_10275 [Oscillospiraceae bacterium]|jgi:hypothetical protein|nr:hypothetical protein [Oscillospiraceae bacterium]